MCLDFPCLQCEFRSSIIHCCTSITLFSFDVLAFTWRFRVGYKSIDALQNDLSDQVFHNRQDRKKAAGRALGTLIEIVTYYLLCSWDLRDHIVIERKLPEFANTEILHNVEFSLHPIRSLREFGMQPYSRPVTPAKIRKQLTSLTGLKLKSNHIVSTSDIKRNAAVLVEAPDDLLKSDLRRLSAKEL